MLLDSCLPLARFLPSFSLARGFYYSSSTPTPRTMATMFTNKVATLMNNAFSRVSPDKVIRTNPVPDAHSSSDVIAPKYLRIGIILPFSAGQHRCCHDGDRHHN